MMTISATERIILESEIKEKKLTNTSARDGSAKTKVKNKDMNKDKKIKETEERQKKDQEEPQGMIKLGSWNLQGIFEEGAIKNLITEVRKYNLDILAVQETHLKGTNITKVDDYVMFTSGSESRRFGVGFLIREDMKRFVTNFEAISDKLCILKIKGKQINITIVNIHAPTEEKEDNVKDEFYDHLETIIDDISKKDLKIVIGDANAKVGNEEIFKGITGGQSKHGISNDNGLRLINFAIEKEMKIMSTCFTRRDIHKGTWIIPGTKETNQIDHILVGDKHSDLITNVRTYRGADADSDHFLVVAKLKQIKLERKNPKHIKPEPRYNMNDLQIREIARKYTEVIQKGFEECKLTRKSNNIENKWARIETTIKEATEKTLTKSRKQQGKEWLDSSCREEIRKRKQLRAKYLQTGKDQDKKSYQDQKKKTKNLCRYKKRRYKENEVKCMEEKYKKKEIRNFYKDVKEVKKGYQPRRTYIKNKEGNLIGGKEETLERWKQYFEELLNEEMQEEQVEVGKETDSINVLNRTEIEKPTREEIESIICNLKNNKSPGQNGITAENIKYGGNKLKEQILELIEEIWTTEKMPEAWNKAVIIPIHKKGDILNCNNYRGIALLDVIYKVLATLVKRRLENQTEKIIGEYQCGFRKFRSTTDQIFILKQVLTSCYEYDLPTHLLFVDFKAAYDTINREKMLNVMRSFGISDKLIKLVKMTVQRTTNLIRIEGTESRDFEVTRGLRQGDPLSTLLFNIALEGIIRESGINRGGTLLNKSHQCLAYADDVVLIARSEKELKTITEKLVDAASKMGLKINEKKSQYMQIKNKHTINRNGKFEIQTKSKRTLTFEETDSYMYLGVLINNKCEEESEINLRLAKSNRCAGSLNRLLRSKELSLKAKLRLYKTILRPTLLYGSETWILNTKMQASIEIWERKILRRIYGGRKTNEGWERRTNKEIYELYNEPIISAVVKLRRLQWLGHLERMEGTRTAKGIAWAAPEGKRKRGRPRRKWREAVLQDIEEKQITNWREKAKKREEWREIIGQWA